MEKGEKSKRERENYPSYQKCKKGLLFDSINISKYIFNFFHTHIFF